MFRTIFYTPLYNTLILISAILPSHNLGGAIIILTLLIKITLSPLQHRTTVTQRKIKDLEPAIRKIKDGEKKDSAAQARQIMALYRAHGVNPFSGILVMLLQLPIVIALFFVFKSDFSLQAENIYSFIPIPDSLDTTLFGLIELTKKNYRLSFLTGLTQFIQIRLAIPPLGPTQTTANRSFKDDLARSFNIQARYVLPVFIVIASLSLPAAVPLYWLVSNLFAIGHELFVRRRAALLPVV